MKSDFRDKRIVSSSSTLRSKKMRKMIQINEEEATFDRLRTIGGYSKKTPI